MTRGLAWKKQIRIPNYFYYVAPLKAIPMCIPDHAGLMLVETDKWGIERINLIKSAPALHKNKLDQVGVLAMFRSVMFKYWDLAETLDQRKIQKQIFNEIAN